jgi:hypothetical protein
MGGSWLDTGHGDGESLVHVTGVPARDVVAPSDRGSASWNSRSSKAVVGGLVTLALIGSAGTAYAIRETLFPSLGAPTSPSVWTNTPAPDESAEVTVSSVTTSTSTSTLPPETSVPAETSTVPATVTSVEGSIAVVETQASTPRPTSGTSDRRGSASNTVAPAIDNSGSDEHGDTTEPPSNTGPSVPDSGEGSVPTTDDNDSSGSGSGGDSDNSGPGNARDDDRSDEPDDSSDVDD